MIIFVVLGIFILLVSFIVAFASLIYEQKRNIEVKEDLEPIKDSGVNQEQVDSAVVSDVSVTSDIKRVETFEEDRLKTAATEIFPWEQDKANTPAPRQDFVTFPEKTKPVQRLNGVISVKDMLSKS
ncbi:hypothetical protein A3J89_01250 [Candidatus Curtissbacteria bacterium RIFOXYB12_FULL_40_6]|nr:MAG: hypothetical protein A3J89_01250 [Candidatus Curtissbacteria bacterium RIFOXYB12_FULL_40_6]